MGPGAATTCPSRAVPGPGIDTMPADTITRQRVLFNGTLAEISHDSVQNHAICVQSANGKKTDTSPAAEAVSSAAPMKIRTLHAELWLPQPMDAVFAFFGDAANLDAITPPWLHFRILTPRPIVMAAGTRIDYALRLHGIPVKWQSEVTAWRPPHYFADEQRRGPYRRWTHRHHFEAADGGTWVRDEVEYAVPGYFLEPIIHRLFVGPDLCTLFTFRHAKMREMLGADETGPSPHLVLGMKKPDALAASTSAGYHAREKSDPRSAKS